METLFPTLGLAARICMAMVFLTAAIGKLRNPAIFAAVLADYRLLPAPLVQPVARLLPLVELCLAALLALGMAAPWSVAAAMSLLLTFTGAMAVNIARGRRMIDCGCNQSAGRQMLSGALLVRNLILTASLGFALPPAQRLDLPLAINAVVAGLLLFLLYVVWNDMSALSPYPRREAESRMMP